jgi:hypothetical protein
MSAVIVPFETRAQRETRLHGEMMAAFEVYGAVPTTATFDTFVQALNRLVAFQMKARRPTCPTPTVRHGPRRRG